MNTSRKKLKRLADAILAATITTIIISFGLINDFDSKFSDQFYQSVGVKSQDIIVIGIDNVTLSKIGPKNSIRRRDVAKAIRYLNNNYPNARPAVIGLDLVFIGENPDDPEGDREIVEVATQYNNVVVGAESDENKNVDDISNDDPFAVWNETALFIPPFQALSEVVECGHINAPDDPDGVARHELLFVKVNENDLIYSFSRVIYEKYCSYKGIEINKPPITESNGIFYLPFTAKSYSVENNFWDLLEGNIDPEVYRNKIVLIGPYAPGLQDAMPTALDRSQLMYGVDIHANMIQAFQKGFFPREVNDTYQLVILFILSFISELFFRNGKIKQMTIIWLSICIGWIIFCKINYSLGNIFHILWIPFSVSFLFVGAISTNYMLANSEKEQIKSTFGHYVDPVVMDQLLENGTDSLNLGGKLCNIAVLFVDIRGFTTMSEKLPPETVVEILNRYLTLTAECIRRNHGTLDKFVGDCTMAFWNAPLPQKNAVHLACNAAMDMIAGSEKLGAEIMERYNYKISFGIGVHWGSAVVGNIGTSFRMDYTAIGDTVNTAARLEANAPGGKILISNAVVDILGSSADVTSLGEDIKLKGKAKNFEIFILNSLKEVEVNEN